MNKSDLISNLADAAGIPKATATEVLETFLDAISKALKKGERISLVGFGTFSVSKRAARVARNPQTGAPVKVAARKVPKFTPGKSLRDIVNGSK